MTESADPFEAAARHEEAARLRREARLAAITGSVVNDSRRSLSALVAFFGPYALWGAIRAASFRWGPGVGPALVRFFFDSDQFFAWYTGWILFLAWAWMIAAANGRRRLHGPEAQH